jgi:hypothetical protein
MNRWQGSDDRRNRSICVGGLAIRTPTLDRCDHPRARGCDCGLDRDFPVGKWERGHLADRPEYRP